MKTPQRDTRNIKVANTGMWPYVFYVPHMDFKMFLLKN